MQKRIHLITIDAAGTLIRPWPSVGKVYADVALKYGLEVNEEIVDSRFYKILGDAQRNQEVTSGEEKDFWKYVVTEVFLPFAKGKDLSSIFEELWNLFGSGEHWRLAEGAIQTLEELRKRNYRLAILSNNDSRLRGVIRDLGIIDLFEHLFISSELGCEKPDLEIFRAVEAKTQVSSDQILHLGDSHSRDFTGARNAGWSAILFGRPALEKDQIFNFPQLLDFLQ